MDHVIQAILIALTSIVSASLALLVVAAVVQRRSRKVAVSAHSLEIEATVFLFDDESLVDATAPARALLEATPLAATDWARLAAFLAPRFEDLPERMKSLAQEGRIELASRQDGNDPYSIKLIAEDVSGLARISLIDPSAEGRGILVDGFSHKALEDEVNWLRHTLDHSPALIWREDEGGAITWANRAYILRSGAFGASDDTMIWPLPALFAPEEATLDGLPRREKILHDSEGPVWFDCSRFPYGAGKLHFAVPVDATVRAEQTLRDFVQTLTKTFADLPIGLAIFDRQRQLQLFNPALLDLTQLTPDFLSARPTLYAFLDRLREARMVPEPKDYRSWREQMANLERAAASGFHSETWSLPSGLTYRVTGRPHPDGAVAFLFEDISAEVSLTRRFRSEIELGYEMMDQLPDAIAVFQPTGELLSSNAAYGKLWSVEPEATLGQVTLRESMQLWESGAAPDACLDPMWKFATERGGRKSLHLDLPRLDGAMLECRLSRLQGGRLMVRFIQQTGPAMRDRPQAERATLPVGVLAE